MDGGIPRLSSPHSQTEPGYPEREVRHLGSQDWPCLLFLPARAPPTCVLPTQVRTFLQPPLKGVVMETFGSGNGPTKPDLLQELRVASEQGLIIVNCTHCLQGAVTSDYASGMVGGDKGPGER